MEIIPLGVGSAFAKTLDNTNYLIRPREGEPFLLDCGHTASRALARLGVPPDAINCVLLSHLHADHIGGLEELGFSGLFLRGVRVALRFPEPLAEYLWTNCLSGGMGQRLKAADGSFFDAALDTYFDVRPIVREETVSFGSVEVTPFRTPHIPGRPSWGFFMRDAATGGKVMFTCDSQLSMKNLETWGTGADAIFHDCQLDGDGEGIHTGLAELTALPDEFRDKIVLVHYGDSWPEYVGKTGSMRFGEQGKIYSF